MLRAEFDSRYRLADRIADGAVESYRAHDLGSGREVLVHLLSSVEHRDYLRGRLETLGDADRASVLLESTVDGVPVVVTPELPGFTSLPEWLGSRPAPAGGPASPGEFTRLFAAPDLAMGPPASPPPAAPPAEGEFTRLFKKSAEPAAPLPAPPPPAAPDPASPRPIIRLAVPPSRPPVQLPPGLQSSERPSSAERDPLFPKVPGGPPGAYGPVPSWPSLQAAVPEPRSVAPVRGPGEIAELISRSSATPAAAPSSRPAPEEAAPPPATGSSKLALIVTLLILSLAAAGLVLYYALTSG
jgi:hypothetical protein